MIEDKNRNSTHLENLGKYGLIERLSEGVEAKNKTTATHFFDDAVEIQSSENKIFKSRLFIENIHFKLSYAPLKHLGYKVVTITGNDIVAMNTKPEQIMVSVAVSNRFGLEAIEELFAGIKLACKQYQIDLVEVDVNSSISGIVISVTAVGENHKDRIAHRTGVKENDLLVVSGDLGAAYFGLQVLERENEVWKKNPETQPDLSEYHYLLERQLKPEIRLDVVNVLKELNVKPTSMIHVSEGLATAILLLSKQSKIDFTIYEDKIPIDAQVISAAEEFGMNPITAVLNGGEDHELLFSITLEDQKKLKGNPNFSFIGHSTLKNAGNYLVGKGGEAQIELTAQGFKKQE